MHTSIHCDSRKALWLCVFVMMNDTWDAMAYQRRALSVSTMASNAGVCECKKGSEKVKKGTRKKNEKRGKEGKEDKQGRQVQIMLSRSLQLSNGSDGHILMMPSLKDSRSSRDSSQEEAASSLVVMTGWRHSHHHHRDTQMDCSTTRTSCSSIHHSWWTQTSGVTTRWKHAMCIAHSNHSVALNEEYKLSRV